MPQLSRRETKNRLRRMAQAQVDMERGTYVWPDGRAPVKPDGTPVVEKNELIRMAGYSPTAQSHGRKWFEDPYFLRHLQLERDRRDGKIPVVAKREQIDGTRVLRLGKKMLDTLETRIAEHPEKFSNAQLLQYTTLYLKQGLEILAKAEPDAKPAAKAPGTVNTLLGDIFVGMDEGEMERVARGQQKHQTERMKRLRAAIDSQLAAREDADDADVIDAEVSTESP